MQIHPVWFAIITYGIAVVIALCVAVIIKIIGLTVRRGERRTAAKTEE